MGMQGWGGLGGSRALGARKPCPQCLPPLTAPFLPTQPTPLRLTCRGVQDGQPCAGQGGKTATPPASIAACVNDGLALVSGLKRDAFAVSMYPSVTQLSSGACAWGTEWSRVGGRSTPCVLGSAHV